MMSLLLDFSPWSVVVVVVCALAMGVVFDRTEHGMRQRIALGIVASVFCLAAFASVGVTGAPMAASGIALVLMTALFAGTLATFLAFVVPFAACLELGGISTAGACMTMVLAAFMGAGIRALLRRNQRPVDRRMVLVVATGASALLSLPLAMSTGTATANYPALFVWLAFTSALFGLLIISERTRAGVGREERHQAKLLKEARQVSAEMLETQLRHHWTLHNRYGVQFGFLIAAIDEVPTLRRALSPTQWLELRTLIARHVREAVRECDICGPISGARTGILMPYIGPAAMARVATRIRDAVADADFRLDMPISVSIGMAHVDEANAAGDLRVIAENALTVARVAHPRGAIGSPRPAEDGPMPLIRSFPGLILTTTPLAPPDAATGLNRESDRAHEIPDRRAA